MKVNIWRPASGKFKSIVMYLVTLALILGGISYVAPKFFGQVAHAANNAITVAATDMTSTGATLNGTNGDYAATGHSFWVSLSTFSTASPSIPAGVYSTPDMGAIDASNTFSASLSSITTTGVPTNLPAVAPNTTYYFAAWSLVGGTWYPGTVLTFTTANGPVFIDTNVNGVLDSGEQSFYTIQAAISAATTGDTIHVTAGTYTEVGQIVIDKNLSIVGADKATTIIKPAQDTSSSGDTRGWFLVQPGNTFNISNVTLDGTGHSIFMGLYYWGNGTVNNIDISNIKYSQLEGRGMIIKGNVDVTNSTFTEMGRIAIQYFGGSGTASGNTMTGKGPGDWLDYGFDIGNGAIVNVENNNISNNLGLASSDGSESAAVMATTYFSPGTQATVTGNTLTNNSIGIAAGYDGTDTAVVVAHNNNISGNTNGLISTNLTVDATNNWWGDASGPLDSKTLSGTPNYNNLSGTGNPVSSYVDYKPWCTDLGCTTSSSANPTTEVASGETTTGATVNGTNGDYDASNTSFWWGTTSEGPFPAAVDPSLQVPSGWTHHPTGTGDKLADVSFNYGLTGLTPGTQYYFVAWSQVGGTWYPGSVLTFTTVSPDTTAPTADLVLSGTGPSVTSFQAVFSEDVKQSEAENPTNYFLNNWPGVGGSGDLAGDATVVYSSLTNTATITFTNPGWYVSAEQEWGVENIHDLAGNLLAVNPYSETSTSMIAPVTTDSGTDSNWHNTNVTVNFSCTDTGGSGCKKTYYTTDGSTPTTSSSFGNSVTLNTDGIYTIKYFSVDNAGNEEAVKTAANTVQIDKTPPVLSEVTPVTNPTSDNTPNYTFSSSEGGGVTYEGDCVSAYAAANPGNNTLAFNGLLDGVHSNCTITVHDIADNTSILNVSSFTVDTIAPDAPTPISPADGAAIKPVAFSQTWTAEAGAVQYRYQSCNVNPGDLGGICTSIKFEQTLSGTTKNVGAGQLNSHFWWRVQAKDAIGNWSPFGEAFELTIDGTIPSSDPSGFSSNPAVSTLSNDQTVDVSWTTGGADALSGVDGYSYDFTQNAIGMPDQTKDIEESTTSVTSPTLAEGTWYFNVRTRDNAGNWTSTAHVGPFIIDTTPPTITNVASDKANGSYTVGAVIDIDVTFSEAVTSTGNVNVTLDTGGTCTFTVTNATTGTCNYTVGIGQNSSDLTISSTSGVVADQAGNPMTNFAPATNLAANKALIIDTTAPSVTVDNGYGQSGNVIKPSITATDDSTPLAYAWTTGVPNSAVTISDATILEPTFTVHNDGTYSFTLIVTDGAGNPTVSKFNFTYTTPTPAATAQLTAFSNVTTTTGTVAGADNNTILTDNGQGVLGASTTTPGTSSDTTDPQANKTASVLGDSAKNNGNNVWSIFGLAWYWWVLILAAAGGAAWWLLAGSRHRAE